MNALERLLGDRELKLPSLPVVGLNILKTFKDDDFSFNKLAATISTDPALAMRTLSVANSALYGLPNKVDDLERAVKILGGDALKNIALSFVIIEGLKKYETAEYKFEDFWKTALTSAVAAELLNGKLRKRSGAGFVNALLMDIGRVVIFTVRPDEYLHLLEESEITGKEIVLLERETFGFDHQQVGREILDLWGLPESITLPVAYHHDRENCPKIYTDSAEILNASSMVSSLYHGLNSAHKMSVFSSLMNTKFGFDDTAVFEFMDDAADKSLDILRTFRIDPGELKPYSAMLEDANKELSKLNTSYEQLVIELKQSKERAEGLADKLVGANKKLRGLAFNDSLTGLYNHRSFHEAMDNEINKVKKAGVGFSLILFDIDNFKAINDSFGHRQGDEVLKTTSRIITEATIGTNDTGMVAARFGGDEFALLMPGSDINEATIIAEKIRKDIEESNFQSAGHLISFTVSVGVGSCLPTDAILSKDMIFENVDKALYVSKKSGRNKVSIAKAET